MLIINLFFIFTISIYNQLFSSTNDIERKIKNIKYDINKKIEEIINIIFESKDELSLEKNIEHDSILYIIKMIQKDIEKIKSKKDIEKTKDIEKIYEFFCQIYGDFYEDLELKNKTKNEKTKNENDDFTFLEIMSDPVHIFSKYKAVLKKTKNTKEIKNITKKIYEDILRIDSPDILNNIILYIQLINSIYDQFTILIEDVIYMEKKNEIIEENENLNRKYILLKENYDKFLPVKKDENFLLLVKIYLNIKKDKRRKGKYKIKKELKEEEEEEEIEYQVTLLKNFFERKMKEEELKEEEEEEEEEYLIETEKKSLIEENKELFAENEKKKNGKN